MLSDFVNKSSDSSKKSQPQQFIRLLSFNYRTIKILDKLETPYLRLEELYLNHNLLEVLTGIEQFRVLRILEIKFNLIKDINEITKISSNEYLINLNLLGNPVEKDYRFAFEFFHRTFPNLEYLNGSKNGISLIKSTSKSSKTFIKQSPDPLFQTSRNLNNTRDLSTSITTFRANSSQQPKMDLLIQEAKKVLNSKLKRKELPEISPSIGFPMQTTATFAKQQMLNVKRKENNSFFLFNSNGSMTQETQEQEIAKKKEMSQIFKERSPIAKNNYTEEISFDMSLNVNLQQEGCLNTSQNQNMSFLAQSHLNKHIENIDEDINGLAEIFYDKMLKEKTLKGLKKTRLCEKESFQKMLEKKSLIQAFYALKTESLISRLKKLKTQKISSIFIDLKEKSIAFPSNSQIRRQPLNSIETLKKKLENTSKKNDSILQDSKQNLSLIEFKEEINQDRVETSRNSISLTGNIMKRRVLTCTEHPEKENLEAVSKSRSFFKNRKYKNKEKNDSFNFPQPLKTLS